MLTAHCTLHTVRLRLSFAFAFSATMILPTGGFSAAMTLTLRGGLGRFIFASLCFRLGLPNRRSHGHGLRRIAYFFSTSFGLALLLRTILTSRLFSLLLLSFLIGFRCVSTGPVCFLFASVVYLRVT